VTGKRPDGYHNLFSLMCRIGVFDDVHLQLTPEAVRLSCAQASVPSDESNLAHRAATAFFQTLGRPGGVDIRLQKRIPVAAGLGGGSSNAASVLLGLNHLHGRPFTRRQLMAIGRGLGADVPFFIFQAPALAAGIGDRLQRYPALAPYRVLLVCPELSVSTRMVFAGLNLRLTNCRKKITRDRLKKTVYSPAVHSCNDLEAVTLALYPELVPIKHLLSRLGAEGALMSGSGPTIFGLFAEAAAAEAAAAALPGDRGWRVISADLLRDPFDLFGAQRPPGATGQAG
jgi:4-diphosphocytidyl-2-C-methyl-D-erythritol kinase